MLDRAYRHPGGGRFVLLSDEWYILAGLEVPPVSFYEGQAIEENGVGQVRAFLDRLAADGKRFPRALDRPVRFTIATGVLAAGIFREHVLPRLNAIENLTVQLQVIHNTLFGEPVTVAGLLPGRDFIAQLAPPARQRASPPTGGTGGLGAAVWTTDRVLNEGGGRTLDDLSPAQISERLGVPFNVAGDSLLEIFQRGISG